MTADYLLIYCHFVPFAYFLVESVKMLPVITDIGISRQTAYFDVITSLVSLSMGV